VYKAYIAGFACLHGSWHLASIWVGVFVFFVLGSSLLASHFFSHSERGVSFFLGERQNVNICDSIEYAALYQDCFVHSRSKHIDLQSDRACYIFWQ
jgi:hypothetical protein